MDDTTFRSLAIELQQSLGTFPAPRQTRPGREPSLGFLVKKIHALKLKMYQEPGHALPHIHIDHGPNNHAASYSINPPERLEGRLDAQSEKIVLSWLGRNKEQLLTAWQSMQDGVPDYVLLAELKGGA